MQCQILSKPSDFDSAEGRDVAAMLNPAPLTIIGTRSTQGRIGFATVLWAMPISHKPAMTAFSLRAKSHTMGIIRETGLFSLSTLPTDAESARIVEACGNNSGHQVDKGEFVNHELIAIPEEIHQEAAAQNPENAEIQTLNSTPAQTGGNCLTSDSISSRADLPTAKTGSLPIPLHALSWELCKVESIQEAGDHLLVIGRVLRAASRASRDEKGRLAPTETLLCVQHGNYIAAGQTI